MADNKPLLRAARLISEIVGNVSGCLQGVMGVRGAGFVFVAGRPCNIFVSSSRSESKEGRTAGELPLVGPWTLSMSQSTARVA